MVHFLNNIGCFFSFGQMAASMEKAFTDMLMVRISKELGKQVNVKGMEF